MAGSVTALSAQRPAPRRGQPSAQGFATTTNARIEDVARRIIAGAGYATFVTLDEAGRPRSRTVQPQPPDASWTVWFATNPRTRKVTEVTRDGRVVLHYFDAASLSYVSLVGRARIVRDRATKDAHWAPAWDAFYRDRDSSVVLVSVTAERLEVVSANFGIEGDKATWLPPAAQLPLRRGARPTAGAMGPEHVDITWMSISNMFYEIGSLGVVTDGYITRIPRAAFSGGGGGYAVTTGPFTPDVSAVTRVLNAIGGPGRVKLLLTGHSHFDHSFDTGTWSTLTGAPVIGSRTTCLQMLAEQVPANRCTVVEGGERRVLAPGVTMYVVRWNHSGDPAVNPEQHNPVELDSVPRRDAATGGLRAGVAEDFPNGGGNRAFLFVVDGPKGRYSWFFNNSASAVDLTVPIVVKGIDFGAPLDNLQRAMQAAGLTSVDLWIGSAATDVAKLVLPVLHPRAFLPVHFDSFFTPFVDGPAGPFSSASLEALLAEQRVQLVRPANYMDKWRLGRSGVMPIPNDAVRAAAGVRQR